MDEIHLFDLVANEPDRVKAGRMLFVALQEAEAELTKISNALQKAELCLQRKRDATFLSAKKGQITELGNKPTDASSEAFSRLAVGNEQDQVVQISFDKAKLLSKVATIKYIIKIFMEN